MLTFSSTPRIYLVVEPVDMRKQFNGLWALAVEQLREDPFSGALFVFINKDRDRVKILSWDGTGVWVAAKRLEKGRFSWPAANGSTNGHPDAGQRSAILYSLIISCECHGKDPLAYLKDILTRLPRMTNQDDLSMLTPAKWHPA